MLPPATPADEQARLAALLVDTGDGRAERALERLVAAAQASNAPQPLRVSVGTVPCLAPGEGDLDALMARADRAMHERKRAARVASAGCAAAAG